MGQFEWKVVSMGLASAPSAFQRLVELVVKGIDHVVVYLMISLYTLKLMNSIWKVWIKFSLGSQLTICM